MLEGPDAAGSVGGVEAGPPETIGAGRRQRMARWVRGGEAREVMGVLVTVRVAARLTQADVAERLGVSRATVNYLERGRKRPTVLLVVRWLGVCGWDLMAVER